MIYANHSKPRLHMKLGTDGFTDVYLALFDSKLLYVALFLGDVQDHTEMIDLRDHPELAGIYADGIWDAETVQDLLVGLEDVL